MKVNKRKRNFYFERGTNYYDFFIIPTIRLYNDDRAGAYLTIEWLKWYIGVGWRKKWGE